MEIIMFGALRRNPGDTVKQQFILYAKSSGCQIYELAGLAVLNDSQNVVDSTL